MTIAVDKITKMTIMTGHDVRLIDIIDKITKMT